MAWKGFLTESKSFMGYPETGRIKFWLGFPRAFVRYWWATAKDHWRTY